MLIAAIVLVQRNVTQFLLSASEAVIRASATVAVNNAVYATLSDEVRYEDLVNIERDGEGNIVAITTNALQVNRIARDTASLSQENLNELSQEGVAVPLGALTGSEALAGFGPEINIKIVPVSHVETRFVSRFESQGINQTLHAIYLEISATISLVLPTASKEIVSVTQVLISESVLLGKVPDVYLQGNLFGPSYDLIPQE